MRAATREASSSVSSCLICSLVMCPLSLLGFLYFLKEVEEVVCEEFEEDKDYRI